MKPKGAGVLYLLKDKFQLYTNSLSDILEFRFSSEAITELNIINKDRFIREITEFITTNSISPNNLVIVIADSASWNKELQPTEIALTEHDAQEQIKPFLQNNPYGHAVHRTVTTPSGIKIFATNQYIYLTIKQAFELKDFSVDYVLPGCVFSNSISSEPSLSIENAGLIFKETLEKKDDNLLSITPTEDVIDKAQSKKDIMRLYAMVNVFGVLVIAVIVTWHIANPTPSQDYRGKAAPQQTSIPSQMIKPEETKQLIVQITYGENTAQQAKLIKEVLLKYQFNSITLTKQTAAIQTKNMILFSPKTPATLRESVLTEVKKSVPNITTHEKANTTTDIMIILGN